MARYASVIGDSWHSAESWKSLCPREPFLGVRFDGCETYVLFEPMTADGPIHPALAKEIRRVFEEAGDSLIADDVFIYEAPNLAAGHRLARRIAQTLCNDRVQAD